MDAPNFSPPYYAVIFTSRLKADDEAGYQATAEKMEHLAQQQPGYLGIQSSRSADGNGVTVSYWKDLDSIHNWKQLAEHLQAQQTGREKWYESYEVRIAKVERQYSSPDRTDNV
ncbi:MAG: antibiotic biosynthesis monooxygenase [Pirellulaceae bacterium]